MKNNHSQFIEQVIREMQLRNYSVRTITTYSVLLTKVEGFFQQPIDSITLDQFKSFLHHRIVHDNVSVSMVNQYISAYKILQSDVLGREWESIKIKRPRREKRLPVVMSQSEMERLICSTKNIKHKAMLMLAYSSGLRREELQKIKASSIDSSRMQVHVVQGKGKKDRYTILSVKTLDILREHYRQSRPINYLFESLFRPGHYLSDRSLDKIVKNNAKKAGISKQVSFHTLRHSFATHLLEQGVNLRLIQEMMGHTSLKTTSGYLHLVDLAPSKVSSPLDSMSI